MDAGVHCRGLKVRSGIPIFPPTDFLDFWIYDIARVYGEYKRGNQEN